MSQTASANLEAGVEALRRNAFAEAYSLLQQADEASGLPADGLLQLAEAALWSGKPDESLEAREKAFAQKVAEGKDPQAGFIALTLAREYGERQESVVSNSWFSRGEQLLEGHEESREFGYLELARSFGAHYSGDDEGVVRHAQRASELGAKHQDLDLQGLSLMPQAMALIHRGDLDAGYKLMDQATIAAVSGELSPKATGGIYCMTISTCRNLADFRRASEWTDAAERWCRRTSIAGFPGICRVHRAEIMSLRGAWLEAEQEAGKAVDELTKFRMGDVISEGFSQIGMIRLRMGDLAGAEDAFTHAHEIFKASQPGLALLSLARGKPDAAIASIKSALADESWDRLSRARLLPALAEIAQATGDLDSARTAKEELEVIAKDFGSLALSAAASTAAATFHLMGEAFPEAIQAARQARRLWQEVGAPYEGAKALVLLGLALIAGGDVDSGKLELRSARNVLEKLGALPDAKHVGEMLVDESEQSNPKTTIKTFMFTDIVGSTDMVQLIGDHSWENLLRWHDQAMRALFAEHHGEEIKQVGDGFFVAFDDPTAAVSCAIAIQRKLHDHRREHGFAPQVRIGLHATSALDREGDYGGLGVHEAARIGALAKGGEILASAATLKGLAFRSNGSAKKVELKGVSKPVEVRSVDWRLPD